MLILKNDKLTIKISDIGAEIKSITTPDGVEYMWQGAPNDWEGTAPNLFPIVGRLREGYYTVDGTRYDMDIHGFSWTSEMELVVNSDTYARFELMSNDSTQKQYPYDFVYTVEYTLEDNALITRYGVRNIGNKDMYYSLGAHPGFNVPFTQSGNFDQYYLEFDNECKPLGYTVTEDGFITGERQEFSLIMDKILPLAGQEIFVPTVFLENTSKSVTLKCNRTRRKVTLEFSDFKYLALWHEDKGPYICIEPWTGTPDKVGDSREIKDKNAMTTIKPNEAHGYSLTIKIN